MEKFKQNVESLLFLLGRECRVEQKKKNNIIVKSYLAQIHYF